MNTSVQAQKIIADATTSVDNMSERVQFAHDLFFYALGTIIAIEGVQKGAEIAYRAADAAVGKGEG